MARVKLLLSFLLLSLAQSVLPGSLSPAGAYPDNTKNLVNTKNAAKAIAPVSKDSDNVDAFEMAANSILTGKVQVFACSSALLIQNSQTGCNLLVPAGEGGNAYVYSLDRKLYARTTQDKFRNPMTRSIAWLNTRALSDIPVVKLNEKKFLERQALCYGSTMKYVAQIRAGQKRGDVPGRTPCELDFRTCRDFGTSEVLDRYADRFFDLPYAPGFPVYMVYKDADGDSKNYFDIRQVRQVKVKKSLFLLPSGLKQVAKYEEIMGSSDLNDFL